MAAKRSAQEQAEIAILENLRALNRPINIRDFVKSKALKLPGVNTGRLCTLARDVCDEDGEDEFLPNQDRIVLKLRIMGALNTNEAPVREWLNGLNINAIDAVRRAVFQATFGKVGLRDLSLEIIPSEFRVVFLRMCRNWGVHTSSEIDDPGEMGDLKGLLNCVETARNKTIAERSTAPAQAQIAAAPLPSATQNTKPEIHAIEATRVLTATTQTTKPALQPAKIATHEPDKPRFRVLRSTAPDNLDRMIKEAAAAIEASPPRATNPPQPPAYQAGEINGKQLVLVRIEDLVPMEGQPRRRIHTEDLDELREDVKSHGVEKPIPVIPHPSLPGKYLMIGGHRRREAAIALRHRDIPCIVDRRMDAHDAFLAAVRDNERSVGLSDIDRALAYRRLMDENGWDQVELGIAIKKRQSQISRTLELLKLHPVIHDMMETRDNWERLPRLAGWELGVFNPEDQVTIAQEYIKRRRDGKITRSGGLAAARVHIYLIARELGINQREKKTGNSARHKNMRRRQIGTFYIRQVTAVVKILENISAAEHEELSAMFPEERTREIATQLVALQEAFHRASERLALWLEMSGLDNQTTQWIKEKPVEVN